MNKEKLMLQSLLARIENDKPILFTRIWFNPVLWIISALIILTLLQLSESGTISTIVVIVVSALLGLVIGAISLIQSNIKQWPYIKKHINTESIQTRISELNT